MRGHRRFVERRELYTQEIYRNLPGEQGHFGIFAGLQLARRAVSVLSATLGVTDSAYILQYLC